MATTQTQFKPHNYNSVSPYLVVFGAQKLLNLLKKIFDAKETRRYDMPDGTIMHVEFKIDDTIIMMGDADSPSQANITLLHVYVSDAVAIYNKAISLGCLEGQVPVQRNGDPDIRGSFKDFAGNTWSVATQVTD